jgi:hypothetical protein
MGGIEANSFTGKSRRRRCVTGAVSGGGLLVEVVGRRRILESSLFCRALLQQSAPLLLFFYVCQDSSIPAARRRGNSRRSDPMGTGASRAIMCSRQRLTTRKPLAAALKNRRTRTGARGRPQQLTSFDGTGKLLTSAPKQ